MSAVQDASLDRADRLAAAPSAVVVDDVTKTFRLPRHQYSTLKERALHVFRSNPYDDFEALKNVSVDIKQGEFFGIVGRNGSGKSTLLKCLAGIYRPNEGAVKIRGRLSPFIELGVGFNMDLAARDNVLINSVMMGMSRRDARALFDEVIAFAELEEFIDLKLKNYSSGMSVRLGFATAIQAHAEVLLVDEVLAVGDAAFQQKCFEEFHRLKEEGHTIVFVTHDMSAVERFCDRAMLIERGEVLQIGKPREIARAYNELNFGRLVHEVSDDHRYGDQATCEITDAWIEQDGKPVNEVPQGERMTIAVAATFHQAVNNPIFGISLRNDVGHTVFTTTTEWQHIETGTFAAGSRVTVRVAVDAFFGASLYQLTPSVALPGSGANALDLREDMIGFYVHAANTTGGLVDLPHDFVIERA